MSQYRSILLACLFSLLTCTGSASERGACIPPQTGYHLSYFLEKQKSISLVPRGWHLKDAEVKKWKIEISFETPSDSKPMIFIELIPKNNFPFLPHGKWFSFRITNGGNNKIDEETITKFLSFASEVDESFISSPFGKCIMDEPPTHRAGVSKTRAIKIASWLYLLLGAFWILLIPAAAITLLKNTKNGRHES